MNINLQLQSITNVEADVLVVNLFEGVTAPDGATGAVNEALGGQIAALIEAGDLTGKFKETRLLYTFGKLQAKRVLIVGLGEAEEFSANRARSAAAVAAKFAREHGAATLATIVHGAGHGGMEVEHAAQALAEGTLLGLYTVKNLKKHQAVSKLTDLIVVESDESKQAAIEKGLEIGRIYAEGTNYARDLINEPANILTPTRLAELATDVAVQTGMGISVLEEAEMRELGMNALLSIGQGSDEESKLIVMSYHGNPDSEEILGLVGKGVTFDTGGYSLKPMAGMENMKTDMGGAGAVIGAMQAIGRLKPKANIVAVIGAVENMVSGNAIKPGDVVVAMNGKSIEIVNTDAEGRVVLADALTYAIEKCGVTKVVNAATLTGAISIALGRKLAGMFSNDSEFASEVKDAFHRSGERVWEMPLVEDYKASFSSNVADMKNTGGRDGGSITAALILREFVDNTPWVHLDVAGVARDQDGHGDLNPKGATGFGVRTLVELALGQN
ncbi:leucyl aminopeptidase [Tumebacillus avium]|uniref:Probable cytosol aminopeptidase n=1 Tax=Tumebacillus avium TaxID=1903704 RepID=A0A1Y0IUP5_9BACL|nr:leucyl aminopeptidase [Tumebacillus avium]ARU63103.1 leucyl aminopeptidase [Tumebacillus avium]